MKVNNKIKVKVFTKCSMDVTGNMFIDKKHIQSNRRIKEQGGEVRLYVE